MSHDVHEVFAVQYAHHARRASENYIFGDPHDAPEPLAYFVWLIRGPHGTFVVDSGFDSAMAARRGRIILHPVDEGLRALDVHPDLVTDVVVARFVPLKVTVDPVFAADGTTAVTVGVGVAIGMKSGNRA